VIPQNYFVLPVPLQQVLVALYLLNLYGDYQLMRDLSLFARWNNVFNKDYQLSYGYNTPGSNVFVGLRYAMK
jgi:vitamin B12 transporter